MNHPHTTTTTNNKPPVILITGALTGIGRATALAFAREYGDNGSAIVVSGRRDEAGQALAQELRALGAQAEYIHADVRQEEDVRNLVDKTVARFGRLDVAINNAGTEGVASVVTEQTVDNYRATFDTNVLGTILGLKHQMRVMAAQGRGSIINLSSVAGQVGMAGASMYVASKHAVEGLTKSVALEGASVGVRVNSVAPGPIETGMLDRFLGNSAEIKAGFLSTVPTGRSGSVEEIAQTILFLASDKASYISGQNIAVDGAYTAR